MPRGDGTGPRGMGAMTGRVAGFCAGYEMPGFTNPVAGRGVCLGRGRVAGFGGGRGWRNRFHATGLPDWMHFDDGCPIGPDTEQKALKRHAEVLQTQLDAISERLSELETKAE